MSYIDVATGTAAQVAGTQWTEDMFGYRYTAYRDLGRFDAQMSDNQVGLIGWPGGYLAESQADRYGLNFDGLYNPDTGRPGLAEMFAYANAEGVGLSIFLPTARYDGNDDLLRADIQHFMGDLLSGHYGPVPDELILEIGSEFYASFDGADAALRYGHIANIYLEEIAAALNDPSVNLLGIDPEIAVQAGRSLAEDEVIRSQLEDDQLAEVDQIVHHRFPFCATGVDRSADEFHTVLEAWQADAAQVGGEGPELFLSAWGVGSYTRDEALDDFLAADHAAGGHLTEADVDLDGRTTDAFESFWQNELTKRDYGAEHPRMILEMMSEYNAEGMTAAAVFGTDMIHPGRLTLTDVNGVEREFIGQSTLDMMAESVIGTHTLDISLQNDRSDEVWVYGFENDDRVVIFLSADGTPPDGVTLRLDGLGDTFQQISVDSLTSEVPEDWMQIYGIPDNPDIDESAEAATYATGVQSGVTPQFDEDGITVQFSAPNEVIRISLAKTDLGAQQIAAYSEGQMIDLEPIYGDAAGGHDGVMTFIPDEIEGHGGSDGADPQDGAATEGALHDGGDAADHGGDAGGIGGIALAILPFLFLLGGGF